MSGRNPAKPVECGSLLPLSPASLLALSLFASKSREAVVCAKRLAFSVEGRPSYSLPAGWLRKATAGCSTPRPVGTPRPRLRRCVFAKRSLFLCSDALTAKAADYFRNSPRRNHRLNKATPDIRRLNWGSQSGTPDIRRLNRGSQSGTPDIRRLNRGSQSATPDIRRLNRGSQSGTPDIRRLNRGSQSASPDIRRPDWQLPVGPPDLFDHLSRHKLAIFIHKTPVFS